MALPNRDVFITEEDALALLRTVVDERGPNHRYPRKLGLAGAVTPYYGAEQDLDDDPDDLTEGQRRDRSESAACHYFATERDAALVKAVEEGAPLCIVGAVLDKLGITVHDLGGRLNISAGIDNVIDSAQLEDYFSKRAIDALSTAQEQQDGGLSWGQALEITEKYLAETS